MKVVVQRVKYAKCHIDGAVYSQIGRGMVVLVGIGLDESDEDIEWLVKKLPRMRIFDDEAGVMNLSLEDVAGEMMVVSQFTLHASTKRGNRPSWFRAAPEPVSRPIYDRFVERMTQTMGREVATGSFGADMQIELQNDGPVTIIIDTHDLS